jgi:hypothetical protein
MTMFAAASGAARRVRSELAGAASDASATRSMGIDVKD